MKPANKIPLALNEVANPKDKPLIVASKIALLAPSLRVDLDGAKKQNPKRAKKEKKDS